MVGRHAWFDTLPEGNAKSICGPEGIVEYKDAGVHYIESSELGL
jgi:hypothetical protein